MSIFTEFKKNMSSADRFVRLVLAVGLLVWAVYSSSFIAAFFGLFTLYEVLSHWCIVYQLLGINRCPLSKK